MGDIKQLKLKGTKICPKIYLLKENDLIVGVSYLLSNVGDHVSNDYFGGSDAKYHSILETIRSTQLILLFPLSYLNLLVLAMGFAPLRSDLPVYSQL